MNKSWGWSTSVRYEYYSVVANMFKLFGRVDEASLAFSLAFGRSKSGLADRHHITLGISEDSRHP